MKSGKGFKDIHLFRTCDFRDRIIEATPNQQILAISGVDCTSLSSTNSNQ